jgi:hypothetical protein
MRSAMTGAFRLRSMRCEGRTRHVTSDAASVRPIKELRRHAFALSRRDGPESCVTSPSRDGRGRRESRVRAAPAVSRALCTRTRTRAYRFSGEHPAFPAQWFYGLLRALLGEPGSFATITSRIDSAKLDASVGRQDHTTSPSAKTTFVFVTSASTASHRNVRDDRDPPLSWVRRAELCP